MISAATTTTADAWQDSSEQLAESAWSRFAVKQDRHGVYSADGSAKWTHDELTLETLMSHFRGEETIGLGVTSTDDKCLWVCWDLDNHESAATTDKNLLYALHLRDKLRDLGVSPLVEHSDGKGGIHVWVLFTEPVPASSAFAFAQWIVEDHGGWVRASRPESCRGDEAGGRYQVHTYE